MSEQATTRSTEAPPAFEAACAAHRAALQSFIAAAERVPAAAWNASREPTKWSPAQITEHLRLSYAAIRSELDGQSGFRVRTSWWRQRLYQLFFLRRILRSGRMPPGVPAVREIRPTAGPYPQRELLLALGSEGQDLLRRLTALQAERGVRVTHPFLGRLRLQDALELSTHHIRHHLEQLPRVAQH